MLNFFQTLLFKLLLYCVSDEIKSKAEQLKMLERELADELATRIFVPKGAILLKYLPIPQIELKVHVSPGQLATVEAFLDELRGTPKINVRATRGLN